MDIRERDKCSFSHCSLLMHMYWFVLKNSTALSNITDISNLVNIICRLSIKKNFVIILFVIDKRMNHIRQQNQVFAKFITI